jgi:hypothetical protein
MSGRMRSSRIHDAETEYLEEAKLTRGTSWCVG